MKIHILSDLHLEFRDFVPPQTDADVVILAGDINLGVKGVLWAMETFKTVPVIYVNGNHEYYRNTIPDLVKTQKNTAEGSNVQVLENEFFDIGELRFFGCTLWTDFALDGDAITSSSIAAPVMPDFRIIRFSPENRILVPADTIEFNKQSVQWLGTILEECRKKTVVVTHHLPLPRSIDPRYHHSSINPAFASDFSSLIDKTQPALWVHGHTHHFCDYFSGNTHIICNPRGYPHERNTGFKDDLTVTV
ncbi:MAG: metallophosphoesterase [Fibrobacter sp.]|nr:metallophosphoesterase [Fibrobacter sp.]